MNILNYIDHILLNALQEDIGNGDVTTDALISDKKVSKAVIIAKCDLVLAGIHYSERTFHLLDKNIKFNALRKDGSKVKNKSIIATISGNTRGLLLGERTALNVLQRLSGIATLTDQYVQKVKGLKTKITDTRKTAPGLRLFDKYAVKAGGGCNHRYGLYDGVLIKDNHIAAAGSVGNAVKLARSCTHHLFKIEVEVKNIAEVKEALSSRADIIMLDNMPPDMMKKAVKIIREKDTHVIIEASGNVTLDNVRFIAETGVDLISVGALTHSAPAADISMKLL